MSENNDDDNIVKLPTLAERQKRAREEAKREAQEAKWRANNARAQASNDVPFFNAKKIPPLTRITIIALIAVQAIMSFALSDVQRIEAFFTFGFVPMNYSSGLLPPTSLLGPFTYMFLHGGWMHLIFNAVMILAVGSFAEKVFGRKKMAIILVGSSLGGALFHFALNMQSEAPVIGASGAVSGLFAMALIVMYQNGQMGKMAQRGPIFIIAIWAALLIVMGLFSGSNVAWQAHLGGFFAGLMILRWFKAKDLLFWRL